MANPSATRARGLWSWFADTVVGGCVGAIVVLVGVYLFFVYAPVTLLVIASLVVFVAFVLFLCFGFVCLLEDLGNVTDFFREQRNGRRN